MVRSSFAMLACLSVIACTRTEPGGSTPDTTVDPSSAASGGRPDAASGASSAEVPRPRAGEVVAIAAGTLHSCALRRDGRVLCWGANDHGQLGAPTPATCDVPDELHGGPPRKVPCTERPVIVLAVRDAVELVAAGDATCARTRDARVLCWGDNSFGLMGDGTTQGFEGARVIPKLERVAQIALSTTHACARHEDGTVSCWGGNFDGQIGKAPSDPPPGDVAVEGIRAVKVLAPRLVPGLRDVTLIAVGANLTCAKTRGDDVSCLGRRSPAVFDPHAAPIVPALNAATQLVLGEATHCGLFADGAARCWGASATGPMLDGSKFEQVPVDAPGPRDARALAIGANRACELTRDGGATCWGDKGFYPSSKSPERVPITGRVTALALGASHACFVSDGRVHCIGNSFYGQAGAPEKGRGAPTSGFWTAPHEVATL